MSERIAPRLDVFCPITAGVSSTGLEAMDEHAESVDANDNFGSTKRQIFQLICDLSKIRKLAAINLTEFDMEQPRVSAAPVVPVQPAAIL